MLKRFSSTAVALSHFAEGSQILTYNFVRPTKKFTTCQLTHCFIALMKSVTQNIRGVTERLLRAA